MRTYTISKGIKDHKVKLNYPAPKASSPEHPCFLQAPEGRQIVPVPTLHRAHHVKKARLRSRVLTSSALPLPYCGANQRLSQPRTTSSYHVMISLSPLLSTMAHSSLFTIPVLPCGEAHPGGSIACSEPQPGVYLLSWSSPPDNRLTTPFCRALLETLDVLELSRPPGVVVTTSAIAKFYSNGLDLAHAIATDGFWPLLYAVWRRFLTYPMPTIALINGHAFAGGLMLATAHDYRLAPRSRGYLCLNELLFGAPLKPAMAALFRHKLPHSTLRDLALEARRFDGPKAVAAGLADGLADGVDDVFTFIRERSLGDKAKSGVYGVIKTELHSPLVAFLSGPGLDATEARFEEDGRAEAERKEFASVWYEQWRKDGSAKL
ncbi:hypothetical protein CP533_2566 [Ophiocordyceps camponoti-saundersi (nom. inval.)]|nr:hypothetical protein CP533_2566 [Ophiocordyceps camponoti-saundersi (nom. inval.)]